MTSLQGVESYLLYTPLPSGLSLWAFFTMGDGFRLLWWCFLSLPRFCSASLRAFARSATLFSTPMLQTAGNTVCSKGKHFNRPRSIALFSLSLRGCLGKTRTRLPIVSTAQSWVCPSVLLFSTRSDRLAPYCFFTLLAGTHNYLAGIHNYFFTIRTMTPVHLGLPLGGWYCTISFFFLGFANIAGPVLMAQRPPRFLLRRAWQPSCWLCGNFLRWSRVVLFLRFPAV